MSKSLYKTLGCSTPGAAVVTQNNCCGTDNSGGNSSFQQVNADWNSESGVSRILNKPALPVALKILVNADGSGVPDPTFDAYAAAGNTIFHPSLVGKRLLLAQIDGATVYDYGTDPIALINGTVDFTSIGGVKAGSRIIIFYM